MDLYTIRRELSSGKSIYDLPLRVTYYARVSTDKEEQKNSLESQDIYYKNKILTTPKWTLVNGYTDDGITGTSTKKRDDFNDMVRDGLEDKFDLILTKEVCRFARNTLDTLQITRELLSKGKGVMFELDNINTLETEGELRLTIMASLAQDESRRISERVKFGFKRSIEKGRVLGNNAIWGYEKNKCKLRINEEEAEIVKKIFEKYATGEYGIRKIGIELEKEGIFTRKGEKFAYSTIRNILTNPKYKGFYCGNKTSVIDFMTKQRVNLDKEEYVQYKAKDDVVPQIIDEKMWERCNDIYKERSEKAKSINSSGYNNKYRYSGKIYCKKDGRAYWRIKTRKNEFWQCSLYNKEGKKGCSNSVNIYTESIDNILVEIFNKLFLNKESFIQELADKCIECLKECTSENDIRKIKGKIEELNTERKKLIKLYTTDLIDEEEFEEENIIYKRKIENLQQEYKVLEQERNLNNIKEKKELLMKSFCKDLVFARGIPKVMIDVILDRIEVEKINDDGLAKLDISLKIGKKISLLYKRKKITKYCNQMQKIAS